VVVGAFQRIDQQVGRSPAIAVDHIRVDHLFVVKLTRSGGYPQCEGTEVNGNKLMSTGGDCVLIEGGLDITVSSNVIDQTRACGIRVPSSGIGMSTLKVIRQLDRRAVGGLCLRKATAMNWC
jgi:hypothetical protein